MCLIKLPGTSHLSEADKVSHHTDRKAGVPRAVSGEAESVRTPLLSLLCFLYVLLSSLMAFFFLNKVNYFFMSL